MELYGFRFRLIDLAAGAVILFVLIGLLLPTIQMARTPARRSTCASHLGELVKAAQQFEFARKRYPGHLEAFGNDAVIGCKVGTWAVSLFPYIEQEPLYDAWQDPSTTANWNAAN